MSGGKSMAKLDTIMGSSRVTNFCINLAVLRRTEARNLEKEPLRRVRPTHFSWRKTTGVCVNKERKRMKKIERTERTNKSVKHKYYQ